jgi:hypothetical protein
VVTVRQEPPLEHRSGTPAAELVFERGGTYEFGAGREKPPARGVSPSRAAPPLGAGTVAQPDPQEPAPRRPVGDPLTWRLARDTSHRHSPDVEATYGSPDIICAGCATTWPCTARRNADAVMRALERPADPSAQWCAGLDYATAAVLVHHPVLARSTAWGC